jgi:hypothetical protein
MNAVSNLKSRRQCLMRDSCNVIDGAILSLQKRCSLAWRLPVRDEALKWFQVPDHIVAKQRNNATDISSFTPFMRI